jgi:formylglycine-generating enzyme required for sulfatase activity
MSPGAVPAEAFNLPPGQTSLSLVHVGDPGNPGDPLVTSDGTSGHGAVAYEYNIGKFEVTIAQYNEFLNAVAATDTYSLYDPAMTTDLNSAGIARSGSSGSYSYSVIGSPNKPIDYVTWGDAARFANWLSNGQPIGAQGPGTTEDGSYVLNGAMTNAALAAVTREASARYVIPTRDEWYKAAFYDPTPGAGGGDNYWLYPMRTDAIPSSDQPPGSGAPNPAITGNFYRNDSIANGYNDGYAVTGSTTYSSSQNYLTDVGAYSMSSSYYGTFDQGGNHWEWDETVTHSGDPDPLRGSNGGSWENFEQTLRAFGRFEYFPAQAVNNGGFRIAEVPEPSTVAILLAAAAGLIRSGRTRK